jgi:hypothetical protein
MIARRVDLRVRYASTPLANHFDILLNQYLRAKFAGMLEHQRAVFFVHVLIKPGDAATTSSSPVVCDRHVNDWDETSASAMPEYKDYWIALVGANGLFMRESSVWPPISSALRTAAQPNRGRNLSLSREARWLRSPNHFPKGQGASGVLAPYGRSNESGYVRQQHLPHRQAH